jgi:DNA helicase II / ATP-dependent DNA helicase PcrA
MTKPLFIPKNIIATSEQVEIQTSTFNTILVEANAGAAKTTTLALRLGEAIMHGLPPERCLALTYTVTAAAALRQALQSVGIAPAIVARFQIMTFDEFSADVLARIEGRHIPTKRSPEALKIEVQNAMELLAAHTENDRWRDDLGVLELTDHETIEDFLRIMLRLKGSLKLDTEWPDGILTPNDAVEMGEEYRMLRLYFAYQRLRFPDHADFPKFRGPFDATYDLARLLSSDYPDVAIKAWPVGIRTLVVDEMHDLNNATHRILMEFLKSKQIFFCGVGDEDQVIFDREGADVRFMREQIGLDSDRQIKILKLTPSFRFGRTLAKAMSKLTGHRCTSQKDADTLVQVKHYSALGVSGDMCAELVVKDVEALTKAKRSEFAVLLRHPSQSVHIENALIKAQLPYVTHGFESYFLRSEVLLVRGLLAVALDKFDAISNPKTRQRVIEAMIFFCEAKFGFGQTGEDDGSSQAQRLKMAIHDISDNPLLLRDFYENQMLPQASTFTAARFRAAVNVIRQGGDLKNILPHFLDALQVKAWAAHVFVEKDRRDEMSKNLAAIHLVSSSYPAPLDFFARLNSAELEQATIQKADKKSGQIVLADIAYVKGLEFESVAIPYLSNREYISGSSTAILERNLFYVGATRTKSNLSLYFQGDASTPSPWQKYFKA